MNESFKKTVCIVLIVLTCVILISSCTHEDGNNAMDIDELSGVAEDDIAASDTLNNAGLASYVDDDGVIDVDAWLREQLTDSGYTNEEVDAFFATQEIVPNDENEGVIYTFTIDTKDVTSILVTSEAVKGPTYQYLFMPESEPNEFQRLCDIVNVEYSYIGMESDFLGGAITLDFFENDDLLLHVSFDGGGRVYYGNGFYVRIDEWRELEDIFAPYYTDENLR